ncbi:MAG: hypothetical protein WC204_07045 [Elusimicrobiales bacterium]
MKKNIIEAAGIIVIAALLIAAAAKTGAHGTARLGALSAETPMSLSAVR